MFLFFTNLIYLRIHIVEIIFIFLGHGFVFIQFGRGKFFVELGEGLGAGLLGAQERADVETFHILL